MAVDIIMEVSMLFHHETTFLLTVGMYCCSTIEKTTRRKGKGTDQKKREVKKKKKKEKNKENELASYETSRGAPEVRTPSLNSPRKTEVFLNRHTLR